MERRRSGRGSAVGHPFAFLKPHLGYAVLAGAAATPLFLLSTIVPAPLFLPVVSLLAIASAIIIGLLAWRLDAARNGPTVTGWDVSGALALIGIAAGMLSDPMHVAQLFGHTPMG